MPQAVIIGATDNSIEDEDLRDEATYKAELALNDVHKIRDELHSIGKAVAVMQQKSADHHEFMMGRVSALAESVQTVDKKVEGLIQDNIRKKGFADGIKTILFKHPMITIMMLLGLVAVIMPEYIKTHFLS